MAAGPLGMKRLTVCRSESGSHSRTTPMPAMAPELLGRSNGPASVLYGSGRDHAAAMYAGPIQRVGNESATGKKEE